MAENEKLVYSAAEAMKALGLSKDCFWAAVHSGQIPHLKLGERKFLFSRARIREWLENREKASCA